MVVDRKNSTFSLQSVVDAIGSPACWLDVDGGLRYANRYFFEMTQLRSNISAEELQKHSVGSWLYRAVQKTMCFEPAAFEGLPQDVFKGKRLSMVRMLDEDGLVTGLLGTVIDDDSLKGKVDKDQEHIHGNTVLNQILKVIPASVFWQDTAGIIMGCNRYQARSLGCESEADVIGRGPFDFFPKNTALALMKDVETIVRTREGIVIEEKGYSPAGQISGVSTKVPLFNDDGDVVGVIGVTIDTTEQKRTEQLLNEEKKKIESINTAKNEFIMNIRHDFRTPLSGIIGYAESLRDVVPPEHIERVDILVNSGRELVALINNVIDVSTILAGEYEEGSARFSIVEMVNSLKELYAATCGSKGLLFETYVDEKIPGYCWGDCHRIKQILIDIISNGVNYTHEGKVSVSVKLLKMENREMVVSFSVSDTGIGMTRQQQNSVFQYFKRMTASYDGVYSGLGMGLWRVKQFIEDLKGEVSLESVPGSGTTVLCVLPLRESLQE